MKPDLWTIALGLVCLAISGPANASGPAEVDEDTGVEEAAAEATRAEDGPADDPDSDEPEGESEVEPNVTASGGSKSKEVDEERPELTNEEPTPEPEPAELKPDKRRKSIKWIKRWRPERHMINLGFYGGVFLANPEHDFYDPRTRPQEPLWAISPDIGVRLGYYPLRPLGIEAEFSANPTRVRSITNDFAFVYGFRGHVVAQLPFHSITPFFLAGYGLMGVRSHILILGDDVDPAFHYGGGLKVFASRFVGFRVEARNIISAAEARQNSGTSHVQVLAGISITFNRKKAAIPKPPPPPIDNDRDKDGILNKRDDCPDTPGIEPHGCPDTDGDGFIDKVDECPEVPGIAPKGCPDKDTDGDGFMDSVDDCVFEPETFNNFEDEDGCPDVEPKVARVLNKKLQGIEFDFGKATIRKVSFPALDESVKILKEFEFVEIQIVGHTDSKGSTKFNQKLSEARAAAVKKYLVDHGIDAGRMETLGKGDTDPIDTNETPEGRAKNRRIQIIVTKDTEDLETPDPAL